MAKKRDRCFVGLCPEEVATIVTTRNVRTGAQMAYRACTAHGAQVVLSAIQHGRKVSTYRVRKAVGV